MDESTFGCDFTYAVPCSNKGAAELTLDTRILPDGAHTLEVAASDPAGNEARAGARSITVDNTAPAAPAALTAAGGGEVNSFDVTWSNPSGQVSPISAARYRMCSADGSSCGDVGRVAGVGISGLSSLAVPGAGEWQLRVWLEDSAGNVDAGQVAQAVLRYGVSTAGPSTTGSAGSESPTATSDSTSAPAEDSPTSPPAILQPLEPVSLDTADPGAATATSPRRSPRLHLTSVRAVGRRVTLRGRIARGAAGPVLVSYRLRHRVVRIRRKLRGGAFRLTFAARRARPLRISMRFRGNARFRPASASARVARRSA